MKDFDYYEFAGLLAPGALISIYLIWKYPDLDRLFTGKDLALGDFGLFIVIAFILGHIIQGLGNVFEKRWWAMFGGMPSLWVRGQNNKLLGPYQTGVFERKAIKALKLNPKTKLSDYSDKDLYDLNRRIYTYVSLKTKTTRIDIFNGNYGLNRGIAVGFLVIAIATTSSELQNAGYGALFLACAVIATYRMHRFGITYAKELINTFLQV
jgi:hypothetical protein